MTYDGYGRLKTKHVPEQDPGATTVWTYNADDTIQKITDARGASLNNTYNSRHLLTGISYSVPPGSPIAVPAAATFTYDAAGNRTSMNDGLGAAEYGYDSLSRLTSETRTFAELTGSSYTLNYSYNLGNALTSLSIPFRSRQIGYNYDTAGRLTSVTGSGFSATYYAWPNQYTQNLTSLASSISYRAWGARKSMTYGNTTSEQITYNDRLQPASYTLSNMTYQNTNVCCSYPTYSTLTWNFGYYDDGSLEHAWDATNDWFDRAYKYDHAGRLKEASTFRRARGLAPYPAVNSPDPYFQSITYDAFDHSNRTGKLYTGEPSDVGTYVNNRRTDFGWQYDANGNTISDPSYNQTIDASGALIHSVSRAMVGDGFQHPYEPQLDITQTYDGSGAPAKRQQISRLPGIIDEFGNQSEPLEDTQTTYYIKSSVLGGATVAEIGGGDTIYIYANGERIAREFWGNVTFEHHNPVTGSWLTSHGHSSYRTTAREERDPRGAETPLSNPFAYANSYVEWKFSSPLFIEGGDPYDYSSGREIDGLPVSEAEFQRRVGSGSAGGGVFVGGKFAKFIDLSRLPSISHVTVTFDVFRSLQRSSWADLWEYLGPFTKEFDLNRRIQNRPTSTGYSQRRSDSSPTQDRQLKFPVVTETGKPLSRCAKGMLRQFLEDGPYWEYRDQGFRVIPDIQLYSGLPNVVKDYALIEVNAFTYGNGIWFRDGIDPASLDNFDGLVLLAHEFAHSLQADRYGPPMIFGALYLIRSGTVSLKGKDPYVDNKYEVDARDFENAFRNWLEKKYGRDDPCKKYLGGE